MEKKQQCMILNKNSINKLLKSKKLVIRPLLELSQVGEMSIDFRLGYDFLVSIQGREPYINVTQAEQHVGVVKRMFQETRRQIGDKFLIHPNQIILANSLEYVKVPNDVCLELSMRSSYSKLGLSISTIVQSGYCGCIPFELVNSNKNPILLSTGARIIQARLHTVDKKSDYFSIKRKYCANVRPACSQAADDNDLATLDKLWRLRNKKTVHKLEDD